VILSVKDDGRGFDVTTTTHGVGLINIQTRASLFNGEMKIISSPGNGTEVIVTFQI
jgi:signal transduction histidine kinase